MLKTGIVTFHRAANYGAVLQAYALQKVICGFGVDCQIIDFRCNDIERFYKPFLVYRSSLPSMVKQFGKAILNYKNRREKKNKIDLFVSKHLNLSEPVYTETDELNQKYDAFITGSDQVFNPDIAGKDALFYFLAFSRKPRFSYAASFGKSYISETEKEKISAELRKFDKISVREESGKEIVRELTGIEAEINIDPTLLLSAVDWRQLENKPKSIDFPYILVYNMLPSELLFNSAQTLSKDSHLKVVVVNNKNYSNKSKYNDFIFLDSISPEEFLWLIDHAKFVLNSSFHGSVFSILFHKNFISVLPKDEPKNARTISLLKTAGINQHLYLKEFDVKSAFQPIDWESVDFKIHEQREKALSYIGTILKSAADSNI